MTFSWPRTGTIIRKELRNYRRHRFVIISMAVLPLVFVALPTIQLFTIKVSVTSGKLDTRIGLSLLIIPAIVPATVSAYSVVGEREQGHPRARPVHPSPPRGVPGRQGAGRPRPGPGGRLRDLQGLPRRDGSVRPASGRLGGVPGLAPAGPSALHPLLAGWSIWVGIAISARSADVRVAQQLGLFASLPPLAIVGLITLNVISTSAGLVLGLAAALLILDALGWRAVAAMFDRERLVTGERT